jgi:transposase-like protein
MICPHCTSLNVIKKGWGSGKQRYKCSDCGHRFYAPDEYYTPRKDSRVPKVLILDIETAPMRVYTWHIFRPYLSPDNIITDTYLLSWAAKWLCERVTKSDVLTPKEAIDGNDRRIVEQIWDLIDEADVIIGHNVQDFDLRRMNERFLFHDMDRPSPYQIIDTLKCSKRLLYVASHKQKHLVKHFGLTEKIDTEFQLWIDCMAGDPKALAKMETYNRADIGGCEDYYLKIRKFIPSHPNMAIYAEAEGQACPTCGHQDLDWRGYYVTPAGKWRAFKCAECGSYGRSGKNSLTGIKGVLRPVAR